MTIDAFLTSNEQLKLWMQNFFLHPQSWLDIYDDSNPIFDETKWSDEIKYMNASNDEISDEIKNLPKNCGGIYMFYVKGFLFPFAERYLLYIGRCKYDPKKSYSINARAQHYYHDFKNDRRPKITLMFNKWKECLYYRYYKDTDNDKITQNEAILIKALLPPMNSDIPNYYKISVPVDAFNNIVYENTSNKRKNR